MQLVNPILCGHAKVEEYDILIIFFNSKVSHSGVALRNILKITYFFLVITNFCC